MYDGLFATAPDQFDIVMTNPPFGGKEGLEAQTRFAFKTGATQVLFLQHVIDSLTPTGRCGMVLVEGVFFTCWSLAILFIKWRRLALLEPRREMPRRASRGGGSNPVRLARIGEQVW